MFSITTAIMLVFAALAPVGYAAFQQYQPQEAPKEGTSTSTVAREDDAEEFTGTWTAWCVAAGITVFAVDGSLAAAIGVVHDLHSAPPVGDDPGIRRPRRDRVVPVELRDPYL